MDKKRASKALDFEAVPKRSQATDERRPVPREGGGGLPRKGLPGPYDPPPGSQAGNAYKPPMTGSRGVMAFTAVPPPADAASTGGPARSQTMPSNRGRLGGNMSSQSSAGTAMGGSGGGRPGVLGQGQRVGLNSTGSKPIPRPAYVPHVPQAPISSGPSPTCPLPNPPRAAAPLCLAKPSPQPQQQQAPATTHPQPVYQPHAPSQQSSTQSAAARLNTQQPPVYRPRTSTSPRPDAPQQGLPGGPQPPVVPSCPSQATQAMAMSSPMTMPTPHGGGTASSVSPIYPPKPPASSTNQVISASQSAPRPLVSQPPPALGAGVPEYRPGVPPSSQQRTAVGLGGARMNGGGSALSQRGLSQPTPAYQPRSAFKGSIKPVPQPHTPDSATAASPKVAGPTPSPSGDAVAMQQEIQRLQASLAKMEEERRQSEEKANALSEALNQKEADALELMACLTTEELERHAVLKDVEDLKRQLTFKDQDLRNAELLRARAEQEVVRRKRKNPGSVVGEDDDDCSRVSMSSPDSKAKSRPIGGGSPPKPMLVENSKAETEGGPGGYGMPGEGLGQSVPPDTLQLSSSFREFADHICCLLSSTIVSSKGAPSSGRPSADQDVFLLRLASTLRPKSASKGHDAHAADTGKAEAVCATLATQLYQALTVATSAGPGHLPAVLQCLASYMHAPEIVGRTRLFSALYMARGLLCMSAECRRSIKLPAESAEGAAPPAEDGGFTSRYRGPPLPAAHPTQAPEEAASAMVIDLPPSVLPLGGGGFLGVVRSLLASLVKDVSEGGEEAGLSSPLVHEVLGILLTLAHETREGQDASFWSAVLDDGALHAVLMNGLKGRQVEVVTVWIEILQCLVQHPGLFQQLRILRQGGFFSDVSHQVMTWHVDQRWDSHIRPLVDCLTLRVLRLLTGVFVKYGVAGRELVWTRGGKAEQQKSAIRLLPSLIHVLNQEVTLLVSTRHDAAQAERAIHLTIARESFVLFSLLGTQQEQTQVLKDIICRTNVKWTLAAIHFRLMNNMVDPSLSDLSEEAEYWTEVLEN